MDNTPSTSGNPMNDFRDRVTEKLKKDIGEMLPDDVLQQLTQRAVEEQFFQERREPQRYGQDLIKPSWFVEEVGKIAKPMIEEYIRDYIKQNEQLIKDGIEAYLKDQNLTLITSAMVGAQMSNEMYRHVEQIIQAVMSR